MNKITSIIRVAAKKALRHKIISLLVAVAVIWGGYSAYGKVHNTAAVTRYVLGSVEKGTLITSVDGTGQVSVSSQLDLKPKVSGNVVSIPVLSGASVKAGDVIVRLDAVDAEKAVRDAEANLKSAQISLQKLMEPADTLSITQAQNALTDAQDAKQNAQDDLIKEYDSGFTSVANTFLDLPTVVTGLDIMLNGTAVNGTQSNAQAYHDMIKTYRPDADQFRDAALSAYQVARTAYDKNITDYKNTSRSSTAATVESLIDETYATTKSISEAVKDTKNFLDLVNDTLTNVALAKVPAALTAHESSLQSYTNTTNGHLGDLLNITNQITSDKNAIASNARSITEKSQSFTKLQTGPDPLDVQTGQLQVEQRQNALTDAEQMLADYSIRAPFDGIVAKINVHKGDPASGGAAVATVITPQKIAEVSLNEVDVAKVKMGDKATLTFDAFPDLTISGKVVQVDTIGTVAQGVVSYNVQIGFDTQDDRVRPSMSVSAAIVTNVKQDVLLVQSSAVKNKAGTEYILVPQGSVSADAQSGVAQGIVLPDAPRMVQVQVGDSNDTQTEITGGLTAGDTVITRTITPSAAAGQSNALKLGGFGGGGGGGGIIRTGGGAGR